MECSRPRLVSVAYRDEHGNITCRKSALFHTWEQRVVPMRDADTGNTWYHAYLMAVCETPGGKIERHRPDDISFMDTRAVINKLKREVDRCR